MLSPDVAFCFSTRACERPFAKLPSRFSLQGRRSTMCLARFSDTDTAAAQLRRRTGHLGVESLARSPEMRQITPSQASQVSWLGVNWPPRSSGSAVAAALTALWCLCPGDAAAYTAAVDTASAREVVLTAAGVLFTASFAALLVRVLGRRASRATSVRLAVTRKSAAPVPDAPVTAGACFTGAALAVLCTALLWYFAGLVETLFDAAPPSDQYAVRNVTGTLRSIVTGLVYLATGLFAANAVGLSGLGVQTLLQTANILPSAEKGPPPPPLSEEDESKVK